MVVCPCVRPSRICGEADKNVYCPAEFLTRPLPPPFDPRIRANNGTKLDQVKLAIAAREIV